MRRHGIAVVGPRGVDGAFRYYDPRAQCCKPSTTTRPAPAAMTAPLAVDGAVGEGGGQVLRSALSLALITGRAFHMTRIRANRDRPGLRPQHLMAVQAASRVSDARVSGDRLGSAKIRFQPGPVRPGDYRFDIGTAGATALVLQTVLLPLALAPGPSTLVIHGGTHVPWSPCFHYLDWQWRPLMAHMGIPFELDMPLAGFYPRGGGQLVARIPGGARPLPLILTERGALRGVRGLSAVAQLPMQIAERQRDQGLRRLHAMQLPVEPVVALTELPSHTPGSVLLLLAEFDHGQACSFALGARGKRAERVADEAAHALAGVLLGNAPVDPWMADQLLLPMALAAGPSSLRTGEVTLHLITNAQVIEQFLPVRIRIDGELGSPATIDVGPATP
jgi:RNA 3'-terminal phosphate cyclase (ATP)